MAKDFLSTLRVYLTKVTEGEHTPAEVAASVNAWVRESAESIKLKIEEEVEHSVAKMGFVKQAEFDALKREFESLRPTQPTVRKTVSKKSAVKKIAVKKTAAKKSASKKAASVKAKSTKKAPSSGGKK